MRGRTTPIQIKGRQYVVACDIENERSLPWRHGLEFAPFIDRLEFSHRKEVWGQYLRAGLVALSARDGRLLARALERTQGP